MRRKIVWLALLTLLIVFGPYGFSRLASSSRMLRVVDSSGRVAAEVEGSAEGPLRIAVYNIAHGRGVAVSNWEGGTSEERRQRLDDIASLLQEIDADIVVLNEVDFDCSWSGSVNQAAYLSEKAGYPCRVEQRNLDFRMLVWKWRFGNAILSRHPISDAEVVDLPGFKKWETALAGKKRAVSAGIDVDGAIVRVIGAHLSHRSEDLRVESATQLLELAKSSPHRTVMAGDMNSTPPGFPRSQRDSKGENALEVLGAGAFFQRHPIQAPGAGEMTFHSTEPRSVIDWILVPTSWHVSKYSVIEATLSDHRPVVAEVMISDPRP